MNFLDRVISWFAPERGINRLLARATLQQIQAASGTQAGYNAGKLNRFTKGRIAHEAKEHALPEVQIDRLRWQSWDLFRNNPYCRKIVRSLQSKVIGRGMIPESLATRVDGTAHTEFRARCKQLWDAIQDGFDSRGLPGQGGQTFVGLQKLALKATMLSGDVLTRLVPLPTPEQIRRDLPIPFALQMIDVARLADSDHPADGKTQNGNVVYRGIEINPTTWERVAYWINDYPLGWTTPTYGNAQRIPAEQIQHLFIEEDIDQFVGTPWFAAAILQTRDTGDLQYNVLKASAMAACIVLGYRRPTGTKRMGLAPSVSESADGSDLIDQDGNEVTKIQPGMFVNLGKDGELQGFSPNQPNTNAEAFIQHMLRGIAASMPGVKGSTVTGDYRNSSFSSERSADNDSWPEIEDLQDWFATSFCQPIWTAIVKAAVLSGYFDGIVSAEEFGGEPGRFLKTKWQGPICKSVNPADDASAAGARMKFGLSSLQMECAKLNVNWRDVLNHIDELYETARGLGLPDDVIANILGFKSAAPPAQPTTTTADQSAAASDLEGADAAAVDPDTEEEIADNG